MTKRAKQLISPEKAGQRLDDWVDSIDAQLAPHFRKATDLIRTDLIENWREEVIRIGTTPYSNAFAESKSLFTIFGWECGLKGASRCVYAGRVQER